MNNIMKATAIGIGILLLWVAPYLIIGLVLMDFNWWVMARGEQRGAFLLFSPIVSLIVGLGFTLAVLPLYDGFDNGGLGRCTWGLMPLKLK